MSACKLVPLPDTRTTIEPALDPVSGVVVTMGDDIGRPHPLDPPVPYQEHPFGLAPHATRPAAGMAHARRSALLMLVGLVASSTPLPYTAVAVIPLVWSGVESVRAMRAMSRGGASTRGIVWSAVGLVMVCVLA